MLSGALQVAVVKKKKKFGTKPRKNQYWSGVLLLYELETFDRKFTDKSLVPDFILKFSVVLSLTMLWLLNSGDCIWNLEQNNDNSDEKNNN